MRIENKCILFLVEISLTLFAANNDATEPSVPSD